MNSELITSNDYMANFESSILNEMVGLETKFDKIKIPIGGNVTFEIPDLENEDGFQEVKEIKGVILCHHPLFSYYHGDYEGNHDMPDCFSIDGSIGVGNPGGKCPDCKYNKFGTSKNGGKACKNKHKLYILREKEIFPMFTILPANSVPELSKYIKGLITRAITVDTVETKLSLQKAVNKGGVVYTKVKFTFVRRLEDIERAKLQPLIDQIKKNIKNYYISEEDL